MSVNNCPTSIDPCTYNCIKCSTFNTMNHLTACHEINSHVWYSFSLSLAMYFNWACSQCYHGKMLHCNIERIGFEIFFPRLETKSIVWNKMRFGWKNALGACLHCSLDSFQTVCSEVVDYMHAWGASEIWFSKTKKRQSWNSLKFKRYKSLCLI